MYDVLGGLGGEDLLELSGQTHLQREVDRSVAKLREVPENADL